MAGSDLLMSKNAIRSTGGFKRAVALAALAALAGVDVVDAAECRGASECGCSNNEFCNFDYGSSGGCESCSSYSSTAACGQDGLPSDGEDDCAACCFGSDGGSGDDGGGSGGDGDDDDDGA